MKLRIYDPGFPNGANEYVSRMFFSPMINYGNEEGYDIALSEILVPESGTTMIVNADHLNAEIIEWFHANDVPLIAFNCIDSASLSMAICTLKEIRHLKKIFMVSGIQNTNISNATVMHENGSITAEPRRFLPDDLWEIFNGMRLSGQLQSLPYVPWRKLATSPPVPFDQKRPKILVRGGNHFVRVLAFFMALRNDCADLRCGFQTYDYFQDFMAPQFKYCDRCCQIFKENNNRYPWAEGLPGYCTSIAVQAGARFNQPGLWNNRCPQSYYWLARVFEGYYGPINTGMVECAMNGGTASEQWLMESIASSRFYLDAKWEFSINMAQRFWQAASVGTVNLLPARAADQDYFPVMRAGEHFHTYSDDLSDLSADIEQHKYESIATATKELYKKWMNPEKHVISNSLLGHIFEQILQ